MTQEIIGMLIYETSNNKRLFLRFSDNKVAWFSQFDKRVSRIRKTEVDLFDWANVDWEDVNSLPSYMPSNINRYLTDNQKNKLKRQGVIF